MVTFNSWLDVIGFIALNLVVLIVSSYLIAKSQHLAKKEDMGEITKIQEEVKTVHKLILAQGEWENQLRLAAIERRLVVHQEAYLRLVELSRVLLVTLTEHQNLLKGCDDWWNNNNLFLTPRAREAFDEAVKEANKLLFLRGTFNDGSEAAVKRNLELLEGIRKIRT